MSISSWRISHHCRLLLNLVNNFSRASKKVIASGQHSVLLAPTRFNCNLRILLGHWYEWIKPDNLYMHQTCLCHCYMPVLDSYRNRDQRASSFPISSYVFLLQSTKCKNHSTIVYTLSANLKYRTRTGLFGMSCITNNSKVFWRLGKINGNIHHLLCTNLNELILDIFWKIMSNPSLANVLQRSHFWQVNGESNHMFVNNLISLRKFPLWGSPICLLVPQKANPNALNLHLPGQRELFLDRTCFNRLIYDQTRLWFL